MGTGTTYLAPDQMFKALDGFVAVAATSETQWRGLCRAIERPGLSDDERFASNADRVQNRAALIEILAPVFARRPIGHWLRRMAKEEVPCAEPMAFDDFRHHQHHRANGMLVDLDTLHWGDRKSTRLNSSH